MIINLEPTKREPLIVKDIESLFENTNITWTTNNVSWYSCNSLDWMYPYTTGDWYISSSTNDTPYLVGCFLEKPPTTFNICI